MKIFVIDVFTFLRFSSNVIDDVEICIYIYIPTVVVKVVEINIRDENLYGNFVR